MISKQRLTVTLDGDFVVFLVGMRINAPWKLHRWLPVARAMPRMLAELGERPELGLLGGEMWFGRTTLLLQYWRTLEQLLAYAKDPEAAHLPAWKAFNRGVASTGDVGVWHETFAVSAGNYESIYVNMPPFGLGRVGRLVPATGTLSFAHGRLQAGKRPAA